MRLTKQVTLSLSILILLFSSCTPSREDDDQVAPNQSDGELLRDLNGSQNNNKTIRFEEGSIKVFMLSIGSDSEQLVEKWTSKKARRRRNFLRTSSRRKRIWPCLRRETPRRFGSRSGFSLLICDRKAGVKVGEAASDCVVV